ncbi:MAG: PilZ domain-containing protein [Chloroflexi bacterium]|nr:PilZ domain-containing protein [Chloroflexota bacterium]
MPRPERRVKTNILTAYRCLDNGAVTNTGFGRTLQLGATGALLESPDPFPVGQALSLEFLLDNDQLVTVAGHVTRVARAKAFQHASVDFDELDAPARRLIDLQIGVKPRSPVKPKPKPKPKTKKK